MVWVENNRTSENGKKRGRIGGLFQTRKEVDDDVREEKIHLIIKDKRSREMNRIVVVLLVSVLSLSPPLSFSNTCQSKFSKPTVFLILNFELFKGFKICDRLELSYIHYSFL